MLVFLDVDDTVLGLIASNKKLIQIVNAMFKAGDTIIVLTNRPIKMREATMLQLKSCGLMYHGIICARDITDTTFKQKLLNAFHAKNVLVIDDKPEILIHAQKLGFHAVHPNDITHV